MQQARRLHAQLRVVAGPGAAAAQIPEQTRICVAARTARASADRDRTTAALPASARCRLPRRRCRCAASPSGSTAKFIRASIAAVENHAAPRSQPATSGGSNSCWPMFDSGTERAVQREAGVADFLQRARDELDRPRIAREVALRRSRTRARRQHGAHDGAMWQSLCRYTPAMRSTNESSGGLDLADEKRPQLARQAPRRFPGGARARRCRSTPSCMPSARRARRNRLRSVGIDRKTERLRGRIVLCGVVEELVEACAGRAPSPMRCRFQPVNTRAPAYTSASVNCPTPIVNSSMTSRAKFSCGRARMFERPSSHTSIAGSLATSTRRSRKFGSA